MLTICISEAPFPFVGKSFFVILLLVYWARNFLGIQRGNGGGILLRRKIGIDAGGSLIKVVYEEKGVFHFKAVPVHEMESLAEWITIIAPDAQVMATGGKASQFAKVSNLKTTFVDEFEAVTKGSKFLLQEQNFKQENPFILVNIGTGTSIFYVTEGSFERLYGSGIGGGTLIGLGSIITGTSIFSELMNYAKQGNREKSDLLVKDIYASEEAPLLGDLTAANFGKAHFEEATASDHMASLIQMIGETILTLALQIATMKNIKDIVFAGGTVAENEVLKNVFSQFTTIFPYNPIFLDKGTYPGAIGAYLS